MKRNSLLPFYGNAFNIHRLFRFKSYSSKMARMIRALRAKLRTLDIVTLYVRSTLSVLFTAVFPFV